MVTSRSSSLTVLAAIAVAAALYFAQEVFIHRKIRRFTSENR